MKIRPVGVELFLAYGRTDMKLTVAFRNFCERAKKISTTDRMICIALPMYINKVLFFECPSN